MVGGLILFGWPPAKATRSCDPGCFNLFGWKILGFSCACLHFLHIFNNLETYFGVLQLQVGQAVWLLTGASLPSCEADDRVGCLFR